MRISRWRPKLLIGAALGLVVSLLSCSKTLADTYVNRVGTGGAIQDVNLGTTTWTASGSPYIVEARVAVNSGATLTIESGATVQVQAGRGMFVYGTLQASGASFTVSGAGNWLGIYLGPDAGGSILDGCTLQSAGGDNLGYLHWANRRATVYVDGCSPAIKNCQFANSAGHGVELYSSQALVQNNSFQNLAENSYAIAYDSLDRFPTLSGNSASGTGILGVSVPGGTMTGTNSWNTPGANLPYLLNGELALADSAVWTIDPGVTAKTDGQRVMIYGTLAAFGTSNNPITFTSRKATQAAGDWIGIYFGPQAGNSELDYVTVSYAGKDNLGYIHWAYRSAGVFVDACSPRFEHLTVSQSAQQGVELYASNARLDGAVISGCGGYGLIAEEGSRPAISNSRFVGNGSTGAYAVGMDAQSVPEPENVTFEANTRQGIEIWGGTLGADGSWPPWNTNAPYVITKDVSVADGVKLTIGAGAVVKLAGSGLFVNGVLAADGDSGPITFTSWRDDAVVGDSNGDGTGSVPAAGDWKGIYLSPGSGASFLNQCTFRYAGKDNLGYIHWEYRRAAVYVDTCSPGVWNCQFLDSALHGLELYSSEAEVRNNVFQNLGADGYAIRYDTLTAFPSISGNSVSGTGNLGIAVPGGTMGGTNTWNSPGANLPYFLNGELALAEGAQWTLDPGVTAQTDNQRVLIYGTLTALGTDAAPITFTSRKATPAPGDWKGVYFGPAAGASQLDHVNVAYAGRDNLGYIHWAYRYAALFVDSCSPRFDHLNVVQSQWAGLELYASASKISDTLIRGCGGNALIAEAGSRPEITSTRFAGNGGNGTGYYTVSIDPPSVPVPSNVIFETNILQGVQVSAGTLGASGTWQSWHTNAPYVLTGDVTIDGPAQLVIAPGTVIKLAGVGLFVNGALLADGQAAPITFTSARDDALAGDTNGDGTNTVAVAGDWKGVYLSPNSGASVMNRCTLRYAGKDSLGYIHWGYRRAAVYVDSCSATIAGCSVLDSAADGLALYASQASAQNNTFRNLGDGWHAIAFHSLDCFPLLADNAAAGTGNLGVYVPDGTIASSGRWTKPGADFPYLPTGNLTVADGTTLSLAPGVTVKTSGGIYVNGRLDARGTAVSPITFTSRKGAPAPGDWKGIYLAPSAGGSALRFCNLLYAGADSLGYYNWAYRRTALYVESCAPQLGDLSIAQSAVHGIMFYGSAAGLNNSLIYSNATSGLVLLNDAAPQLANNTVVGNGANGIDCSSGSPAVVNNILAFNATDGIVRQAGNPVLQNNCVFGNSHTNYNGLPTGTNDVSVDPRFVAAATADYHLADTSPLIDAGNNTVVQPFWTDLDDHLRVVGAQVDLGAYEFGASLAERVVDGLIRTAGEAVWTGTNIFDVAEQTKAQTVNAGVTATYYLKAVYSGNLIDNLRVTGAAAHSGWTVQYFDSQSLSNDLTAQITSASGLILSNVNPGSAFEFRLEVTPGPTAPGNEVLAVPVTFASYSDQTRSDTVQARTTAAPQAKVDLLVRRESDVQYVGGGVINATGDGQTKAIEVEPGQTVAFAVQVVNSGNITDSFVLHGGSGGLGWTVRYFDSLTGTNDTTAAASGGGLTLGPLSIGAATELRVVVTAATNLAGGASNQVLVSAVSGTDTTKSDTVKLVTSVITNAVTPQGGVYTLDADFEKGVLNGVEHQTAHDQLQLAKESVTLPFIWVPNSNEGTVSKVDTRTGRELGRYRTGPTSGGSPSRTTVDHDGNCWVANRVTGTVIKIGLYENGQYLDRNGNGTIETSRDVNGDGDITGDEILPWGQDECVLLEIVLIPGQEATYAPGAFAGTYANDNWNPGPRGIAVDAQGNVWLGTYGSKKFYYVDGSTGHILRTNDVSSVNHTSYGALIDANGVVWSAGQDKGHVLRLDPSDNSFSVVPIGHYVYGIGLDRHNHLFVSGWSDSKLSRVNVLTGVKEWTVNGFYNSRGVAVTDDGDVWVANSGPGTVTRWSNDGVVKATIPVGAEPTGVAVDASGKVWDVNNGDEYIKRIDPAVNAVDLSKRIIGGAHYGYSDMTGIIARTTTTRLGLWTVIHNSRFDNTAWGTVSWQSTEPAGTSIKIRVRSSADQAAWSAWETATNGVPLSATPNGKYLQIEATFQIKTGEQSPVLFDLTVTPSTAPPQQPTLSARILDAERVEISWPNVTGTWDLDAAEVLGSVTNWQPTGLAPVLTGDRYVVTVVATNASRFYRLRQR
ncbi:MAG: right-handed parallel beta-helix repeat-containing protein [Verrucomicrobia bacterium]|nr:right-handed parallel beta-helix repeat-containing protein [Verrucomicrobiota bacterium]